MMPQDAEPRDTRAGRLLAWIDRRLPLSEFARKHLTGYPTPRDLSYLWNFGSVAGLFLAVQVVTGLWLAMVYKPDASLAFDSVQHLMREVRYGWLVRYLHAVGASALFLAVYVHVGRGIYYGSYRRPRELLWWIGLALFLCLMAEAFMGYLLPWGQMSYWSATVITNLFGVVPLVGPKLVLWLRGDFAVGNATLGRFFALHVALLPVAVIGTLVVVHLSALHRVGSSSPAGLDPPKEGPEVVPFSPNYVAKDLWFGCAALTVYLALVFFFPTLPLAPENSEPASALATPAHIAPEWYFLPFYTILRSIPDKLAGALAMGASLAALAALPWLDRSPARSVAGRLPRKILSAFLFADVALLAWVGQRPPLGVALTVGRIASGLYLLYFLALPFVSRLERGRPRGGEVGR